MSQVQGPAWAASNEYVICSSFSSRLRVPPKADADYAIMHIEVHKSLKRVYIMRFRARCKGRKDKEILPVHGV
jgi:hypothetical protein